MREIRKSSWHFWLFTQWWDVKNYFLARKKNLPERIGLCEYVRGILLGALVIPIVLAFCLCIILIGASGLAVIYVIASAVLLIFCGTIGEPQRFFKMVEMEPWRGRYRLAIPLPWVTIYPWQILAFSGTIWLLVRFPIARYVAVGGLYSLSIAMAMIVGAFALTALCYGSYKGWKSLRESDAYQLVAGYAKAIKDRACPILTVVDDQPENVQS